VTIRTARTLLVGSVIFLVALGIVMLTSTSSVRAEALLGDPLFYLKRQVIWLGIGVVGAAIVARVDYKLWQRFAVPLAILAVFMLILVFVPHVGVKVKGSHRWLQAGPVQVQPSEFAKFVMIICMSAWMAHVERRAVRLTLGLLYPLGGLGLLLGLLMLEPDFGTTMLAGTVGMLIMYLGGTRLSHLIVAGFSAFCLFVLAILHDPLRLGRLLAFIFPDRYPATAYHLAQSKVAFINGGLFGVGLGNSIQKQFYLPEAHTDFILAIIGEERGLVATGAVVLLFLLILVAGMHISSRAPDTFGRLLGFGVTLMLVVQACINIGVVTGCLPTKGLALPFISYGGSSLVASLAGVGFLLGLARHCNENPDDPSRLIHDRAHSF